MSVRNSRKVIEAWGKAALTPPRYRRLTPGYPNGIVENQQWNCDNKVDV